MWAFEFEGDTLPVTNLFDADGEDTSDPSQAFTLVAQLPNGKWLACQCYPDEIKPYRPQ